MAVKKMYKIVVSTSERDEIMERFDVKKAYVYKALNFLTDSVKAKKIRTYAVDVLGHEPFIREVIV